MQNIVVPYKLVNKIELKITHLLDVGIIYLNIII